MKIESKLLRNDEKTIFELRSLYEKYGYAPYKMSKFEEYDLYVKNKDFLVSDNIITFTDTSGKLMALKPDVTLSIIKSSSDIKGYTQKVYYNENVYRVSKSTDAFKEIMQVGLECIGDICTYSIYEVLYLALESLNVISDDFVLDVSHMGIILEMIKDLELESGEEREILKCIGEKNAHQIMEICKKASISEEKASRLTKLCKLYGSADKVIPALKDFAPESCKDFIAELESIIKLLSLSPLGEKVHIDFSVVNDMGYYNGIVFKGFVNTISEGILSGGQYDKLMKKMKRKSRAIGFAVYPDLLERFSDEEKEYDVDTVILYDENTDLTLLTQEVASLAKKGESVTAQKNVPEDLRYKKLFKIQGKGLEKLEDNA